MTLAITSPVVRPGMRPSASAAVRSSLHAPGLGWLPVVWRRTATWKTVLRFVLLGPLIGGAPYVIFVFPIPFAYGVGALPAALAGWLFAIWYHGAGRTPGWAWRAAMGAMSGAAAALACAVPFVLLASRPEWFMVWVVALHGVPAAVVLALLQKPALKPALKPTQKPTLKPALSEQ